MLNENNSAAAARMRPSNPRYFAAALAALLIAAATAARAQINLDHFNGFESGGVGDYQIAAGSPTEDINARTGQFALVTTAAAGANTVVSVSLSTPASVLTDGIWLCVDDAPSPAARSIRAWYSGGTRVAELVLDSNRLLDLRILNQSIAQGGPVSMCPSYTRVAFEYHAVGSGTGAGTALLRVGGGQDTGNHNSSFAITRAQIGPDDSFDAAISLMWDDHWIVRSIALPADFRVAGLDVVPFPAEALTPTPTPFPDPWIANDPFLFSDLSDYVNERPHTGDDSFLSPASVGAQLAFCVQSASSGGVFGNIIGVKTLVTGRNGGSSASLGIALRVNSRACGGAAGATSDFTIVPLSAPYLGVARYDMSNPSGGTWTEATLNPAELFISAASGNNTRVTQILREVAFDTNGLPSPTPTSTNTATATPTPSATSTRTQTPTRTPTPVPTSTPTDTPSQTPTVTPTDTDTPEPSNTPTRTRTATETPTATETAEPTHTEAPTATGMPTATVTDTVPPTDTPTVTHTPLPTETPTQSPTVTATSSPTTTGTDTPVPPSTTPTETATIGSPTITPTETPTGLATDTPTDSPIPTATITPTETLSPTPTATGPTPTPLPPRGAYIFGGSVTSTVAECTTDAVPIGLSSRLLSLGSLISQDPAEIRDLWEVVYIVPGLQAEEYIQLNTLSKAGGFIDRFVSLGGVAVINVAGATSFGTTTFADIAPRGVDFQSTVPSNQATIATQAHGYITGDGYGGVPLDLATFLSWGSTLDGALANVPGDATVVLRHPDGRPSWIEYNHGAGRVIVTTLNYCKTGPGSQGSALDNLLRYSRFFNGTAQTPGLTVTPTSTPSPTATGPTRTPTTTRTATFTREPTSTATPTVIPRGDVNDDGVIDTGDLDALIAALFVEDPPDAAHVNADIFVSAPDVTALLTILAGP